MATLNKNVFRCPFCKKTIIEKDLFKNLVKNYSLTEENDYIKYQCKTCLSFFEIKIHSIFYRFKF